MYLSNGNRRHIFCHMATPSVSFRLDPGAVGEISDAETGAMLRAFFNLTARWALNNRQGRILLGSPAARTYARWKAGQVDPSFAGGADAVWIVESDAAGSACHGPPKIRSIYPPVDLFEDIADPADWELIAAAEAKSNPRARDAIGAIHLVPPERRVSGAGASRVMAPFCHVSPHRTSRFADGSYGVYYAGDRLEVALAETMFHFGLYGGNGRRTRHGRLSRVDRQYRRNCTISGCCSIVGSSVIARALGLPCRRSLPGGCLAGEGTATMA